MTTNLGSNKQNPDRGIETRAVYVGVARRCAAQTNRIPTEGLKLRLCSVTLHSELSSNKQNPDRGIETCYTQRHRQCNRRLKQTESRPRD